MRFYYLVILFLYCGAIVKIVATNSEIDSQSCFYYTSPQESNDIQILETIDSGLSRFGIISEKETTTHFTEHFSNFIKKKTVINNQIIYNVTKKDYLQSQSFFVSGKCTTSKKQFLKLETLLI